MKQAKKHSVLRVFLIESAILLLLVAIATFGYIFRKPIRIAYHRNREAAAMTAMHKSWEANGANESYQRHQDKMLHHKEALLNLGYRERHVYQTQYLRQGSMQDEQLFEAFRQRYPKSSYTVGWQSTSLEIEDLTERMPVWDQLIETYDVPIEDPCQPVAPGNREQAPGS